MPSLGGALEIVGVRAVFADVRQYVQDGRTFVATNQQIEAATKRLNTTSLTAVEAQNRLTIANQRLLTAQAALRAAPGASDIGGDARQAALQKEMLDATKERAAAEKAVVAATAAEVQQKQLLLGLEEKNAAAAADRRRIAIQGGAVGAVAVTAIIGADALSQAASYQTALTKINVLTNTTDEETAKLGKDMLTLAQNIPVKPSEAAAAAYVTLSSGVKDTAEAFDIVTQASKDQAVGLGEAKDNATLLTTVLNVYGKDALSAAQANDIFVQAVKEGRAEGTSFASALGRVIPIAKQMGVSFQEVSATLAVLTNGGLSAEEGATGLRGILNDLARQAGPEAQKALASVGLTAAQLRSEIRDKGLTAAMEDLIGRFHGNLTEVEKVIPNIRALNAAYSAFVAQGGKVNEVLDSVKNSQNAANEAYEKSKNTLNNQVQLLKNQFSVALIQIGTTLLPKVTKAVQDFSRELDKNKENFNSFATGGFQVFFSTAIDLAKGILTIANGLGFVQKNIVSLIGPSRTAAAEIALIGTALAFALPGGPIIKGLTLIVGLIGAIKGGAGQSIADDINGALGLKTGNISQQQIESQVAKSGSIDKAIDALTKGMPGVAEELKKQIQQKFPNIDLSKGIDELSKYENAAANAAASASNSGKVHNDVFNQIIHSFTDAEDSAQQSSQDLADKIKDLEKTFQDTSAAAGQSGAAGSLIELISGLKDFGVISYELAQSLGLSATQAGNIEGNDAVAASEARATQAAYAFNSALAAVAQAFTQSAQVAENIVLDLAKAALDASQQAAANLFSKPTREVADANVSLSQSKLSEAQNKLSTDPQLNQLNRQSDALDQSIQQLNDQLKEVEKQEQNQYDTSKQALSVENKAADAANKAAENALRAFQDAHLQEQLQFEEMNDHLSQLIDQNNKARSDLQKAFLKNNEALQKQINEAIGKGDSATALKLVDQQRTAAKAYQDQDKALQDSTDSLEEQQKALRYQQNAADRAFQAQEQAYQQQVENTKALKENVSALEQDTKEDTSHSDAIKDQIDKLEKQKEAISNQIKKINDNSDSLSQNSQQIQDQIDVYQAETDILKAQVEAADQTLLTQNEQADAAKVLIKQIYDESGIVKTLSEDLGKSVIPGFDDATLKYNLATEAFQLLTDKGLRDTFIDKGINPAAERLNILAGTTDRAINSIEKLPTAIDYAQNTIISNAKTFTTTIQQISQDALKNISSVPKPTTAGGTSTIGGGTKKNAEGGLYSSPTNITVGETYQQELVLPLERPARARELLKLAPISLLRDIFAGYGNTTDIKTRIPAGVLSGTRGTIQIGFAPNISVTGESLDQMRALAHAAIEQAFARAFNTSRRSGGLITQGIGPNR